MLDELRSAMVEHLRLSVETAAIYTSTIERGDYGGVVREWLYWYDENGQRYPTPNERIQQESQRAWESEQRAEKLAQKLRELGSEPEGE